MAEPCPCVVCGSRSASEQRTPLNGLPKGLFACDGCRQAVRDRQVGVVVRLTGDIYVTDGREVEAQPLTQAVLSEMFA